MNAVTVKRLRIERYHPYILKVLLIPLVFIVVSTVLGCQLILPHSMVNSWLNPPGSKITLDYSFYGYLMLFMSAVFACFVVSTLFERVRSARGAGDTPPGAS